MVKRFVFLLGLALLPDSALSAETDTSSSDSTIVVAHRRAEALMAVPIAITVITEEDLRKSNRKARREFRPECRRLWKARENLSTYLAHPETDRERVSRAVNYMSDGDRNGDLKVCRDRPDFALTVAEQMAGPDPWSETYLDHAHLLIDLHEQLKRPESLARIRDIKRGFWVRGIFYGKAEELGWTQAEQQAFVSRHDVWKFLNAQGPGAWRANSLIAQAYLTPGSQRFDLAKGADFLETWNDPAMTIQIVKRLMTGDGIAKNEARAERMLAKVAPYSYDARVLMVERMVPRLLSADPVLRNSAVESLLDIAKGSSPGSEARRALIPVFAAQLRSKDFAVQLKAADSLAYFTDEFKNDAAMAALSPWLDRTLRRGKPAQKAEALARVKLLLRVGNVQSKTLFDAELLRTGGLVDLGLATPEMLRNRTLFTTDDYPARAMRQEEEDVIGLSLIVGPDGRVIQTFVERGTSPTLIEETGRIVTRRARFNLPANMPGRYAKVRLPDVQWRLAECMKDAPPTAAVPGATVIDSWCRIEVRQR